MTSEPIRAGSTSPPTTTPLKTIAVLVACIAFTFLVYFFFPKIIEILYGSPGEKRDAAPGAKFTLRHEQFAITARHPTEPALEGQACTLPEGAIVSVIGQDRSNANGQWLMNFAFERNSVSSKPVYWPTKCPVGGQVFLDAETMARFVAAEERANRIRELRDSIQRDGSGSADKREPSSGAQGK